MICKLCDIANIKMGQSPSGKDLNSDGNGIPFLQGRKTFGRIYPTIDTWTTNPKKIVKKDSILLSLRAPVGDINVADQDICIGRGLCSIEPKKNCLQEYLYYLLLFNSRQLRSKATGTTFEGVNRDDINNLKVEVPDLETQKKIVRVLSALDQKIELNHKISNNLLRISHQVYLKEIKGTATARTEKLGRLCRIKYGKGLPTSKVLKNGYRVYGGNGIIGFYNEKMYDESQVLISCRGAASGKVIFTRPECFVTNNSLILECDEKYHYFVKEYSLDREYYDYTTGSAQPQITIDNIKDVELPLPNDEVLIKFNDTLRPIEKKFFAILDEDEALAKLRDILLPK